MLNISDFLKIGLSLFWAGVSVLFFVAAVSYPGNVAVYALFTLISSLHLFFGFRSNAVFFDTFIGVLMWLGFWFKFSVHTAFMNGYFKQAHGSYVWDSVFIDNVLLVSSCGLASLILASVVRSRWIYNYPSPRSYESDGNIGLFMFYRRYRRQLVALFLLFVVVIAFSNAWLGIYQRGVVPRIELPFGLGGVYSWLLLFGMSSFVALVLQFELRVAGRITLFSSLLALFETFASSVSLLSRGMILNFSALFYGLVRSIAGSKLIKSLRVLGIAGLLFCLLFVVSVSFVNHLRWMSVANHTDRTYAVDRVDLQSVLDSEGNSLTRITDLVLDRWVGVEGVMAVVNYPGRGWNLWSDAWGERYDVHETSFYDLNFIDTPYKHADTSRQHYVSLPGLIAFFYYPGSYVFLFVSVFLLGLVASSIEYFVYRVGGKNLVLCALMAQVMAYRYSSFGYVPSQSYLLFGSIILNVILIWFVNRIFIRWFGGDAGNSKLSGR